MEVDINNDILVWAVERAGISFEEAEKKSPNFFKWLEGKKKPTLKQLQDFARKLHLPFGYLFLDNPPKETVPIPFFRTGKGEIDKVSLNVYDTILMLQQRQEWLTDYLKNNDYDKLDFVGKFEGNKNISEIVKDIRDTLQLEDDWASLLPNWESAKEHLTEKIEDAGIITVFNGVVNNSTNRKISVEECRGFVLVDKYAPFMFINAADSKAAQMFTLAHELAHIWIGSSAGFDLREMIPAGDEKELLCDSIAAELLVPQRSFELLWNTTQDFQEIARHYKVSQIVAARRALDSGKISREDFFEFYNNYMQTYHLKKEKKSKGGDFYATQGSRLSKRFFGLVHQALKENKILYRDAWQLTGLKGNTFDTAVTKLLK